MSFDVKHSISVANVSHQQNLLSAVFNRASRKIQLVRKIQDGSCTSSFDGHNKLFSFSDTGQHMGIVLQEKGTIITCGNTNMTKITARNMAVCQASCKTTLYIYIYSMKPSQDNYGCTFNEILFSKKKRTVQVLKPTSQQRSLCFLCFPDIREVGCGTVEAHSSLDQRRFTPVTSSF